MTGKKVLSIAIIFIVILGFFTIIAYLYINNLLNKPYKGYDGEEVFVVIERGTPVSAIMSTLIDKGILSDSTAFKLIFKLKGGETKIKAGEYRFVGTVSPIEVYNKLVSGDIYYHRITIVEGYDIFDIAELLGGLEFIEKQKIEEALKDPVPIKDIDANATNLEGCLFPDTYLVSRTMGREKIISMMVSNFRSKFNRHVKPLMENSKLDFREGLIIASLIEKETSLPEEREIISSVIHNRLRLGMGLQIDPTIIYALKKEGEYDGNLKRKHKQIDSPFNTYKYRGLPPTPIGNPGLGALLAAWNPAKTKYLYYVSKNDGSHVFSTNIKDHNRAVYIWQKKYWIKKWREERREKNKNEKDKNE